MEFISFETDKRIKETVLSFHAVRTEWCGLESVPNYVQLISVREKINLLFFMIFAEIYRMNVVG